MAGQQFTLFSGTLAGTGTLYTEPFDVTWAKTLTLRVRFISGVGTATPTLTATLESSPAPTGDNSAWKEIDGTALGSSSGIAQETWEIAEGTVDENNFAGFVRGKIALTGTDPVISGEVHLIARD